MDKKPPPGVGRQRKWFRLRRQEVSAGGTYDDVTYAPLLEGEFLQITRISLEDADTDLTGSLRVHVEGHGYNHPVGEELDVDDGVLYWIDWPTYLVPGEKLVARFTGATSGDKLNMYVEGWRRDYPLPEAVSFEDLLLERD